MRARIALRPRRPHLPRISPVLRRGRGKATELLDEAAPLVDRSREAAASMTGVVDRSAARRARRRRRGAVAVLLLLVAAGVAVWLMWRRQDDEYARLVAEPDQPDLTPTPMPEPPQPPAGDDELEPRPFTPPPPSTTERAPMTAAIPASAVPPTMVEEVRSEFEPAVETALEVEESAADQEDEAAPAATVVGEAPAFTMPPQPTSFEVASPTSSPDVESASADAPAVVVDDSEVIAPVDETAEPIEAADDLEATELVEDEAFDIVDIVDEPVGDLATPIVEEPLVVTLEAPEDDEALESVAEIAPVVNDQITDSVTQSTVAAATTSTDLEEAVDEIVASIAALEETVAASETSDVADVADAGAEVDAEVPDAISGLADEAFADVSLDPVLESTDAEEVAEAVTAEDDLVPAAERLDQVLLAPTPTESVVTDEIEDALPEPVDPVEAALTAVAASAEAEAEGEPTETAEDQTAPDESVEVEASSEAAEPDASGIPPWPGTAEAAEESAPLTASDAPSPPPPPAEPERNASRPNPPRTGPPTNPSGAPFRAAGDQLPSQRSWPTLPR